MNLKGKNFLKMLDFTPEEIEGMIDLAADLKAKKKVGIAHDTLARQKHRADFEKTSTRTRCASRLPRMTLACRSPILTRPALRSARRKALLTPPRARPHV